MADAEGTDSSSPPSSESDFYATETATQTEAPGDAIQSSAPADSETSSHDDSTPVVSPSPVARASAPQPNGHGHAAAQDDSDNGSSEMDLSESESSRSSSLEPEADETDHNATIGTKRKLSDTKETLDALEQALVEGPSKKRRQSSSPSPVGFGANDTTATPITTTATAIGGSAQTATSRAVSLPTELWQQIFLRLSPAMLSRCLRVCRTFNTYLTNTKAQPVNSTAKKPKDADKDKVKVMDSDAIWAEARKNYFPNMPRPLMRCNELTMLQLIGCRSCQFCQRPPAPVPASSPFNAGPGPSGIRVVWPFGIRTCGQCWEANTLKDVQILVSPAAALRFGIPYAFRTPDLHFVPEMTRQLPGGIPSHLRVAKVYYNADVQAIQEEHEDVKGYGQGTADEWRKGLLTKGKEAMADAARWEKWESQMRFGADLPHVLREYDLASYPLYMKESQGKSATGGISGDQPSSATMTTNGPQHLPQPVHVFHNGHSAPFQGNHPHLPPHVHRPVRNLHDVEEARAARKADIERRCMDLEPPLEPKVLQHIESFQAAMQITTPMNDAQWEMLRPRILAQREFADLVEHQKATQLAALQSAIPSAGDNDVLASMRPAKEVYDKEYEKAQDSLRRRLGEYADETIQASWQGGQILNRDNAPSFAIQVILHVRKRYLEDKRGGQLPDFAITSKDGRKDSEQGTPQPEPFLSLDNMKWVYDNKVRTATDAHRKELFICAGCVEERKPKWFAFEGLIQHYGAKHTSEFSKGNIVVHWQTAEWPDEPPFATNPGPWIKIDKKSSHYHHSRKRPASPRQDVQYQDGDYEYGGNYEHGAVPPSPGTLLGENMPFTAGIQPQQSNSTGNGYFPYGQPGGYVPFQQAPPMTYDAQITKLAADAREIWDALDGVKDLLECVRMQTVIHHVVGRFQERFYQRPSLDLVTDALANNPAMRPLKNAHGLACKSCVAAQSDGSASYQSYYARIRNVKSYNASSLITHFKIVHPVSQIDWTAEMIELPEIQLVSDLLRAPGMDDEKLALVAEAFPHAFATPLPSIGVIKEARPDPGPDSGLASRLLSRLHKKPQHGKKKKASQHANANTNERDSSQEFPEPGEDEYDPRRPMGAPSAADPARFDTDLARKKSGTLSRQVETTNSGAGTTGTYGLAPETLAALNSISALTSQRRQPEREERSPSVGRAEPGPTPLAQGQAPDISAILASLVGSSQQQQPSLQTATPPVATFGHSAHAPYATTPSDYRPSSRRSSARYAVASPAQDLRASLARNSSGFAANRELTSPYGAGTGPQYPSYDQPSSQQHVLQPEPRSPPRYRVLYEDEQSQYQPQYALQAPHREAGAAAAPLMGYPTQQAQPQPFYHQLSPLQPNHHYQPPPPPPPPQQQQQGFYHGPQPPPYNPYRPQQVYEPQDQPQPQHQHQYQYQPQHAKPVYVDEYGRRLELIPIPMQDAAPAPVQFVPHPWEQRLAGHGAGQGYGQGYDGGGGYYEEGRRG